MRRFLAEGATGTFFRTKIGIADPDATQDATAVVTFERGDGVRLRRPVTLPAGRSMSIAAGALVGLEAADVSTTIESNRFVGVERSMTWGTTTGAIFGSHAETATAAPSTTWFLPRARPSSTSTCSTYPEAAGDHDHRHGPLPPAVGHDDHPHLRSGARQPHHGLRERGPGAGRDRRVGRGHRPRWRSLPPGECHEGSAGIKSISVWRAAVADRDAGHRASRSRERVHRDVEVEWAERSSVDQRQRPYVVFASTASNVS